MRPACVTSLAMATVNDVDSVDAKDVKPGDGRRRKGPLGAIRSLKKLFTGAGRRNKHSHQDVGVYKAKSTSELLDVGRSGSEDGSASNLSVKNLSVSADNVFRQSLGSDPGPYTEDGPSTSRAQRPMTTAAFGKELSLLLQKKSPGVQTDEDDDDDPTSAARPSEGKEGACDGRDTLRMSAECLDVEMENPQEFFQSNWSVSNNTQGSQEATPTPVDSSSLDLNSIPQTNCVNLDLQRHKLAVKPKGKRASSAFIAKHTIPVLTINSKLVEEDEEEDAETSEEFSPTSPHQAEKKTSEVATKPEEVVSEKRDSGEKIQSQSGEVTMRTKLTPSLRNSVKSSDSSETNDEPQVEENLTTQDPSKRSSLVELKGLKTTSERQSSKSESDKDDTTELSMMLSKFQKRNSSKLEDSDETKPIPTCKSVPREAKPPTEDTLSTETRVRSLSVQSKDSVELNQTDLSNSSGQKENLTPDESSTTKVSSLASRAQRFTANTGEDEGKVSHTGIGKSQSMKIKTGSPSGQFKRDSPINKDRTRSKTLPESKEKAGTKMLIMGKSQQEDGKGIGDVPTAPLSERRQLVSNEPSQLKTPVTSKIASPISTTAPSKPYTSLGTKTTAIPSKSTSALSTTTAHVSSTTSSSKSTVLSKPVTVSSKPVTVSSKPVTVSSKPVTVAPKSAIASKPASVSSKTTTVSSSTATALRTTTISSKATTVPSKTTAVSSTASPPSTKPSSTFTYSKLNTQKTKPPSVSSTSPASPLDSSPPIPSPLEATQPEQVIRRGSSRSKPPAQNTPQSFSDQPSWMVLAKSKTAKFNQAQQTKPESEAVAK